MAVERHSRRNHDRQGVQAASTVAAARAHRRQPLPQFLEGTCPDVNGALVNGYLGNVWKALPKANPNRSPAALVEQVVKHPISVFNVDASTALYAFKAGIERGGFTREAINTALETKIRGLPTPGGRLYFSPRTTAESNFRACGPDGSRRASRCRCSERHSAKAEEGTASTVPTE